MTTSPPNETHVYEKRAVVFMDILGFKDHLKNKNLFELVTVVDTFRKALTTSAATQKIEFTAVSDKT